MAGLIDAASATGDRATRPGVEALRRVDWRFLVASPELGRVALDGPADAVLRAGLAATSAGIVALERASAGVGPAAFDVAVLVAPSAGRLEAVGRRCRPGAWVVAELAPPWRRLVARPGRRACGPGAAARALRRTGLEVELRWTWPSFAGALELVPLDDPAALEHSLRRRRSRRARAALVPIRVAARLGWLAGLVPSVIVVARRPAAGDHAAAVAGFATQALAGTAASTQGAAPHDEEGRPPGATGRPLLLTPRFPASRHVVVLGLDEHGRLTAVAKAPRRREDDGGLQREAAALDRIAASGTNDLPTATGGPAGTGSSERGAGVAPRSLGLAELRGWPVLLETALAGQALGRPAIRADRERWIRAADLLAVHLAAAGGPLANDDRLDRLVTQPLRRLVDALPARDPLATLAERTVAALGVLSTADLPFVLEHGDLAPPNLLVEPGGDLAAIDWELAEPSGLPGHDLALFLHFAAVAVAGPGTERDADATGDAVEAAFAGPSPWARDALRRHLEAIAADPDLALPLALAAFARVACSMPGRAARVAGPWLASDRHAVGWARLLEHVG